MTGLRLVASVHGAIGVLAAAALVHPAVLLWRGRPLTRGARWALGSALTAVLGAFALGLSIYGAYRRLVRPSLFASRPDVGWLFETKEHLAYGAVALALGAAAAAVLAPRDAMAVRCAAARLFAAAALVAWTVVALGAYVASVRGFPAP